MITPLFLPGLIAGTSNPGSAFGFFYPYLKFYSMEKLFLSVLHAALMCSHHRNKSDVRAFDDLNMNAVQRLTENKLLVFGLYDVVFTQYYGTLQLRVDNTYSLDVVDRGQELFFYIKERFPEPIRQG